MAVCVPSTRSEGCENCSTSSRGGNPNDRNRRVILTDRGTNLLSHLMKDVCSLLGTKKLTTAYHPQYDGMVERFNLTLIQLSSVWDGLQSTHRSCATSIQLTDVEDYQEQLVLLLSSARDRLQRVSRSATRSITTRRHGAG